jgi:hypothetical protein
MGRMAPLRPGPDVLENHVVQQRREHVQVLGVRQVVGEEEQPERVNPPAGAPDGVRHALAQSAHGARDEPREQVPGGLAHAGADLAGEREQQRHHEHRDHAQNEERVTAVHRIAGKALGLDDQPAVEQPHHRREHETAEELLRHDVRDVERAREQPRVREAVHDALHQDLERAQGQHAEAPEHERMHDPAERVAQDLGLRDADEQEVLRALAGVVRAVFRVADFGPALEAQRAAGKEGARCHEAEGESDVEGGHVAKLGRGHERDNPCPARRLEDPRDEGVPDRPSR